MAEVKPSETAHFKESPTNEEIKKTNEDEKSVEENPIQDGAQPQQDAFSFLGEIMSNDLLYKIAFIVLGMLILLCIITSLIDPGM